jgi:hypothetical protein
MSSVFFQQRLKHLEAHIASTQKLCSEYEEMRNLSADPRTTARCDKAIEDLRKSAGRYYQEFESLQRHLAGQESEEAPDASEQLAQIEANLRVLMGGQIVILEQLDKTRQALLSHYDSTQRNIIAEVINQFNQNQLQLIQSLLYALETNETPQTEIEEMWILLEKRLLALPSTEAKVAEIIKNPGLDINHKLKFCIPIIPLVLDYEGEIELGAGLDIRTLWDQMKAWLRR